MVRSSTRLDGVEKNQIEDVGVEAVGGLVDELDVPAVRGTRRPTSGSSLMRWAGAMSCCTRTSPPDLTRLIAGTTSSTIFRLVNLLRHLDHLRLQCASIPVSTVSLGLHLLCEREDADLAAKAAVSDGIPARPRYCCEEHHLLNV